MSKFKEKPKRPKRAERENRPTRRAVKKKIDEAIGEFDDHLKNAPEPAKKREVDPLIVMPTGLTLLNLALTDCHTGGFFPGRIYNVIGDSDSGKTFLTLSGMADAIETGRFDDYEFYYDDDENANGFDMEYLFGKKTSRRITLLPPEPKKKGGIKKSITIQDLQRNIYTLLDKGKKFFYAVDSLDAVTSVEEQVRLHKQFLKKVREGTKKKKEKGSYKMEKPKALSELFRNITGPLDEIGSIFNIVSQTRDNIGFAAMFTPQVRSGGRALKFYSTGEVWIAAGSREKRNDLIIGGESEFKVTKNKITGKKRTAKGNIYSDYGVDDIEACIRYLMDNGHWKKGTKEGEKTKIKAVEFDILEKKPNLIKKIEDNDLVGELREITGIVWSENEDAARLTERRRKYE